MRPMCYIPVGLNLAKIKPILNSEADATCLFGIQKGCELHAEKIVR